MAAEQAGAQKKQAEGLKWLAEYARPSGGPRAAAHVRLRRADRDPVLAAAGRRLGEDDERAALHKIAFEVASASTTPRR